MSAAGEYDADAKTYKLTLKQSSKKEGTLPFHIPVVVGLLLKEDGSEVRAGARREVRWLMARTAFVSQAEWLVEGRRSCWLPGTIRGNV